MARTKHNPDSSAVSASSTLVQKIAEDLLYNMCCLGVSTRLRLDARILVSGTHHYRQVIALCLDR